MKNIMKITFVLLSSFALLAPANAGEVTVTGTAKATYRIDSSDSTSAKNGDGKAVGIQNELAFTGTGELDNGWTWKWQIESDPDAGTTSAWQNDDSRFEVTTGFGTVAAYVSEGSLSAKYAASQATYGVGSDTGNGGTMLYGTNLSTYNNLQYHTPAGLLPYGISLKAGYTPGGVSQEASSGNAGGDSRESDAGLREYNISAAPIDGMKLAASYAKKEQNGGKTAAIVNDDYETGGANVSYAYGNATIGYGKFYIAPNAAIVDHGTDAACTTDLDCGVKYFENTMMGISYAVNDALSVSYEVEESTAEKRDVSAKVTYDSVAVDLEVTTIQAAYTMGGMTMSLALKDIENADYLKDKDETETIFAIAMAF